MISESTFTKEWIQNKSSDYKIGKRRSDPMLIEKVTKALHLLEELAKTELKFIFKGGTSLLLLLNKMYRFSIDIDIIIEQEDVSDVDVEKFLTKVIEESKVFIRYEENVRHSNENIPKAHYKFFYISLLDGEENYILLDILFEKNCYVDVIKKNIDCKFIEYKDPPVYVDIPSIDCILGDKLTAYAPNTTGISYGKDKELEIIKQLFDIANLFDSMENLEIVSQTFRQMAQQELIYRGKDKDITYEDVLDDIFETSKILGERGRIEKDIFKQLQLGVNRIKNYILSKNYILESAVNSASKAAYLSLLIKHNITEVKRYKEGIDLRALVIDHPDYLKFKTIMKFNSEAYFYWYQCINILSLETAEDII